MSSCSQSVISRYQNISSPTMYDILLKLGYPNQAVSSEICPLKAGARIVGPAKTISGESVAKESGEWGTAFSYEFFRQLETGDVIVFDCGGHSQSGPWGGNTAATAQARGVKGILIDGGTRDFTDLVEMEFPTYCRFVTPVLAHGRFQINEINGPAQIAGQLEPVQVHPGDLVLADDDGIVIIPQALAEEIIEYAEYAERIESEIRKAIESGEDRESIDRRLDRWALLKERTQSE